MLDIHPIRISYILLKYSSTDIKYWNIDTIYSLNLYSRTNNILTVFIP